jgi:hypothetical protein
MKYYKESRRRGICYKQCKEGRLTVFGHILRMNCLLKHVNEGKIQERSEGIRRKRRKQLLDDPRKIKDSRK